MKKTKRDEIINDIAENIISGKYVGGMEITRRDYYMVSGQTMAFVYKQFAEWGIIVQRSNNTYIFTDDCREKVKKMYLSQLSDEIAGIAATAKSVDISETEIIRLLKEKMGKD